MKKKYYQKKLKQVYRAKRHQPELVTAGLRGTTMLLGSASILFNSAPVAFGAEQLSSQESEQLANSQTQGSNVEVPVNDSTEITEPVEPTDPVEPIDPVDPIDPIDPTEPVDPTNPVDPLEPTEPVDPLVPIEPKEPVKPTEPADPTVPEKPLQPKDPEAPEKSEEKETGEEEKQTEQSVPVEQPIVSQVDNQPVTNLVPSTTETSDGSIHFEKDESVESFIKKIGEPARKIGQKEDLYASVMIAQAILESASGQSQLAQAPNYNLFGIKGSYKGKSVTFNTQEDLGGGNMTTIQAEFRAYENYEESFDDYATLMKQGLSGNSEFYSGTWKANTKTYEDATRFLTGRYATDSLYNKKLNGLIETYKLTEYDKEKTEAKISTRGFIVPVEHYTISSAYGVRGSEFHRGLDMAASQGEPIYASKAGSIKTAEYHYSWGNYVVIEHEDGATTLYAHQSQYVVKPGDQVKQGQIIGYVGSTGNSTGSHLHFEVCRDSSLSQAQLVDPATLLF